MKNRLPQLFDSAPSPFSFQAPKFDLMGRPGFYPAPGFDGALLYQLDEPVQSITPVF